MIHPLAYRNGLIAVALSIAYTLIAYLIGPQFFANWWLALIIMVVIVAYLIYSLRQIKTAMGGYITFGNAFLNFMVMAVLYIVIGTLFMYILIWVIDPDFGQAYADETIEKIIGMMEGFNTPVEAIEEAVTEAEADFESQKSLGGNVMQMLKGSAFMAVVGLIVAAVMKKNPPIFDESETLD